MKKVVYVLMCFSAACNCFLRASTVHTHQRKTPRKKPRSVRSEMLDSERNKTKIFECLGYGSPQPLERKFKPTNREIKFISLFTFRQKWPFLVPEE